MSFTEARAGNASWLHFLNGDVACRSQSALQAVNVPEDFKRKGVRGSSKSQTS